MPYKKLGCFKYENSNNDIVNIKDYVLYEGEDNNLALLRFKSKFPFIIKKFEFEVIQYDSFDNILKQDVIVSNDLEVKFNKKFIPLTSLLLDKNCNKFIVDILKINDSLYNKGEPLAYNVIIDNNKNYGKHISVRNYFNARRVSKLFIWLLIILICVGLVFFMSYLYNIYINK